MATERRSSRRLPPGSFILVGAVVGTVLSFFFENTALFLIAGMVGGVFAEGFRQTRGGPGGRS